MAKQKTTNSMSDEQLRESIRMGRSAERVLRNRTIGDQFRLDRRHLVKLNPCKLTKTPKMSSVHYVAFMKEAGKVANRRRFVEYYYSPKTKRLFGVTKTGVIYAHWLVNYGSGFRRVESAQGLHIAVCGR